MESHRLLEHTADMGIEVHADTLEELFAGAACALKEMILGEACGRATEERTVQLRGWDHGELLIAWLNEILYCFEVEGLFPVDFELEEVCSTTLKGRIRGEPFDPLRHPVEREVKAVTYHKLQVEPYDGRWLARLYVDL
jgi:SHS2 domain-containing protein